MEQLLATKLFIPSVRQNLVVRPRLIEQLNACIGPGCKLTLISAPAGFGKTTIVADWIHHLQTYPGDRKTAWLSLGDNENVLVQFLLYVVASLREVDAEIGKGLLTALRSPEPPSTGSVLTTIINELTLSTDPIILTLDDYHLITNQAIHDAVSYLLDNMPSHLHLVIATREDPFLPLSKLRARGQMTELRAVDLRFTTAEAADFLNRVMGLGLSETDIAALEGRTEGWIAGLQLAAISLRGQSDISGSIRSFTGSNRYVLDYLIEDVLDQQPDEIETFLLQTAILDQMTASLCDAVTRQEDSQSILENLERTNLFIVPLDDERGWYRYHQLFADLLQQRLEQVIPERIPALHRRASEWYEQEEQWPDAIQHAFAAEELDRVADLAELAWRPMNEQYRAVTWLSWVKALPDEVVRSRPVLSIGCGWASLDAGDLKAAERHFQLAEEWQGKSASVDDEEHRFLSAQIANGRAYLSQALGDMESTVEYARRASTFLREDEYFDRGLSAILPGFAYWASGDLEAANNAVSDAVSYMQKIGKLPFVISFTSYLADIMTAQGRLHEAIRLYRQLLETANQQGKPDSPEIAVVHLGLSGLFLEKGEMESAREHLERSKEFGELTWFAPWYRHWVYAHSQFLRTKGDLDSIFNILNSAKRLYYRHPIPDVRPLKSMLARVWIEQGNFHDAQLWVNERGLSVDDDLSYLREHEHITLARLLIARSRSSSVPGDGKDAVKLLRRLLAAAEEGGRAGSVIEILVLLSLALEAQGQILSAIPTLEGALKMAESQGYVRVFVSEGPTMSHLLYQALSQGIEPQTVQRLLAAFPVIEVQTVESPQSRSSPAELIELLSERELEVLQLIAEGLTNPEIAARLYLSLNTVKAHTRNIYGKLDVNNRTQAVTKGRGLGLVLQS